MHALQVHKSSSPVLTDADAANPSDAVSTVCHHQLYSINVLRQHGPQRIQSTLLDNALRSHGSYGL